MSPRNSPSTPPAFQTLDADPPLTLTGAIVTTTIRYYYVNGLRMAEQRNGVWTWIHSDHLHSATVITDAGGAEVRRLAYAAFGEQAENTGTGNAPKYTYTAKETDASGLMYYGARYYDPVLARFITADTMYDVGPQGLKQYIITILLWRSFVSILGWLSWREWTECGSWGGSWRTCERCFYGQSRWNGICGAIMALTYQYQQTAAQYYKDKGKRCTSACCTNSLAESAYTRMSVK